MTTDRHERALAVDPTRSVIVQAPAGSGKTELLSQRYLRLLGRVKRPENILAITFTRKATQEMRDRILGRLRQAAMERIPEAQHEQQAYHWAQRALARDKALDWGLLERPARLQVHTIDGLCARINLRFPRLAAGLSSRTVDEHPWALYLEAAQRTLEDLCALDAPREEALALKQVLLRLDGNARALQELLADMLDRRERWLGVGAERGPSREELLALRQSIELDTALAVLGEARLEALASALEGLAAHADDSTEAAPLQRACTRWRAANARTADRVAALHTMLAALSKKTAGLFSPRSLSSRVVPGSGEGRSVAIEALKPIVAHWLSDERASALVIDWVLTPPLAGEADSQDLEPFFRLLIQAAAQLSVLFSERQRVDFQDVAHEALTALGDDLDPGDALLAEDSRLEHILMDEFQDTSELQHRIIERLVSGWAPGDGNSLFLVGDPMQSIYRFRKADVSLFVHAFERGRLAGIPLERVRLRANFRSNEAVVDWVNAEFPRLMALARPASLGQVSYAPFESQRGAGGEVCFHAFAPQDSETTMADWIVAQVRQYREANPEESLAILTRRRKDLEPIARALRIAGLSFEGVDLEPLSSLPVSIDLMALLRVLVHPADRIAWLALLRAPWCGLDIPDLHEVMGEDPDEDILQRLRTPGRLERLSAPALPRVQRLADTLEGVLARRSQASLRALVESAWVHLHGPCACETDDERWNANRVLECLERLEQEDGADLVTRFNDALERQYADSSPANVRLMTIHKAKGLEFDTVILPALDCGARGRDGREFLRIQDLPDGEGGPGTLVAPFNPRGTEGIGLLGYLRRLERDQSDNEAVRLLYVAATRARRRLLMTGQWSLRGSGNNKRPAAPSGSNMALLWSHFEPLAVEADGASAAVEAADPQPLPRLVLEGEPAPMQLADLAPVGAPNTVPGLVPGDWRRLALGQALHDALEFLHDHWSSLGGQPGALAWLNRAGPALCSLLQAAGAPSDAMPGLQTELEQALRVLLDSNRFTGLLDTADASAAEISLFSADGVRLRESVIDLLVRDSQGKWVIVDYKSGAESMNSREAWRTQLQRYREVLAQSGRLDAESYIVRANEGEWIRFES